MPPRKRCPVCGSKQWRKEPSSGLITCEEGHVLQSYRNESREVTELGPHAVRKRALKSGRKKKGRQSKANPKLYHGERARYHYFQCLQLLLRMQIVALTKAWDLPAEFEIICRDIWALHLSLFPNSPLAEPYLYACEQHGGKRQQQSDVSESSKQQDPQEDLYSSEDEGTVDSHGSEISDSPSSSSSGEDEEDPELEKLLRENSATPSSSEDEEQLRPKPLPDARNNKRKEVHRSYDTLAGNISVLMVACWTLRLPVMYMDFVKLIEAYDLPYLDPLRLLPESLTAHLAKQTIQALSPHFAPTPMHLHRLTSRLARLMYQTYSVYTPECNAAPLLWRAVRSLQGNPSLYMLTKKLCGVLSLPLTLHHTLAPKLNRIKQQDPDHHKYDNAPPEVSLVSAVIVVLKLVYGLDGKKRVPQAADDPACALPNLSEYMAAIRSMSDGEGHTVEDLLSANSTISALDMDDEALDEYLDFCEKALLSPERKEERGVLGEYFPMHERAREAQATGCPPAPDVLPKAMSATRVHEESSALRPGQAYAIYHTQDVLGSLPEDYETVVKRAAKWTGVEEDYVCGVVERYENRLARWWARVRRREKADAEAEVGSPDEDEA